MEKKKQSDLERLLGYAGNYRVLTYLSWLLAAASAFTALVPFWYIWRILKEVLAVAPEFDRAEHIARFGWMAVCFAALALLVYVGALLCSHLAAFRIATNIRVELAHHIAGLPLGRIGQLGSGRLRRIIAESAGAAETYLAHQLPDKARALATAAGLLLLLLAFDWRLGLLSLVPVALGFAVMLRMTGKRLQEKMTEYQNALSDMSNEAVEYVRGIPVVKTFGQTVFSFRKFKASIDRYSTWAIAYTKELRGPMMLYTLAINSVFIFLIAAGLAAGRDGAEEGFLLNLVFYIIITPVISVTLTKLMYQSENAMLVGDALRRCDTVLQMPPLAREGAILHPKDASVELCGVTFSYDGSKPALSQVSLKIGAGEHIALVGPSGGGKTTLASLIARFFDPQEGSVRVGGADVRQIKKEELMNTVSFVFQDSRLIKASVLDNVRLGKPGASDAEVMQALRAAQCMDIIEKLPDGADTVIGEKGMYLSGGEAQRIAIARAMLKDAPVILLDEATAFADPDNEARVQAAFNELARGKTVVMIAHRLSTVVNADCIYVLRDGRIAESGTSEQLIKADGVFGAMWRDYQSAVRWKVAKEA